MEVIVIPEVQDIINRLGKGKKSDPVRAKKVGKTLRQLETDHSYPGLHTHRYEMWDAAFGVKVWESYVESNTPSAWRIWWYFGPNEGQITVIFVGPHP